MSVDYEELHDQRKERLNRAYSLRIPDRVPVTGVSGFFAAAYCGMSHREYLDDYEKSSRAAIKTSVDFGADMATEGGGGLGVLPLALGLMKDYGGLVSSSVNGKIHDILGVRYGRFPGRELPDDKPFQFIGQEFMKPDEYDELIEDPRKFIVERLLPRSMRSLERPGSPEAMAALVKFGEESRRRAEYSEKTSEDLRRLGFPIFPSGFSYAPLDLIGDYMRDIKNVLLDCYRMPEKVKEASEAVLGLIIEMAEITARVVPEGTRVFIPLHLNEYFSPKQYNEFYWPTLKEVCTELIKLGLVPNIFYEGYHDAHLETILELPKGKTISRFEKTDLRRAKEIIGGHSCIIGGPPPSLFMGTPTKVEEYVKDLLEDLKPGGGFILSPSVSIPSNARPENVHAMVNAVKKYGVY